MHIASRGPNKTARMGRQERKGKEIKRSIVKSHLRYGMMQSCLRGIGEKDGSDENYDSRKSLSMIYVKY